MLATAAGVVLAVPARSDAKPKPPPNPTNGQISAAQAQKNALATRVGQLSGQIAQAEAELQQLQGQLELAEQKVAYTHSLQIAADQASAKATAARNAARTAQERARRLYISSIQETYIGGGNADPSDGTLLTAQDPSSLLEESTLEDYISQHKIDAIGQLEKATVARSNADADAKAKLLAAQKAATAAQQAKQQADDAVAAERQQAAQLQTMLTNSKAALQSAQAELATLNHQRAAYEAYVKEQARLAAIRKAREEAARRAAARARARERAREQGNGGGVPITNPGPSAPNAGHWTQAEGDTAVRRAESTLGTPYAWAGGNASGPTYGVCDPSNGAPNDCHVYGYDCSGLAMYAWGPYLSMAHYAATQYVQAGRFHPSAGQLRPGDLVFWSFNGAISGIHHVAIYAGNGKIIEAPYSGGYVQWASLWEYGSFFGATRPLT